MRIFVDADACPVKDIVIKEAHIHQIPIYIVSSLSHDSQYDQNVQKIVVDNVPEAVDMAIANHMKKGDLIITQDYGLAAIVMGKQGLAMHHSGKQYTNENIDDLLYQRHLSAKIRRGGGKTKGPKSFTKKDKENFREALKLLLVQTCSSKK